MILAAENYFFRISRDHHTQFLSSIMHNFYLIKCLKMKIERKSLSFMKVETWILTKAQSSLKTYCVLLLICLTILLTASAYFYQHKFLWKSFLFVHKFQNSDLDIHLPIFHSILIPIYVKVLPKDKKKTPLKC